MHMVRIQGELQDKQVQSDFDIMRMAQADLKSVVMQYSNIDVDNSLKLTLDAVKGKTLISGMEIIRQP